MNRDDLRNPAPAGNHQSQGTEAEEGVSRGLGDCVNIRRNIGTFYGENSDHGVADDCITGCNIGIDAVGNSDPSRCPE